MLERACILALGKLGAAELNYSSDIDLVAVYDDRDLSRTAGGALGQQVSTLARGLREVLSAHSGEGAAYRVDWRLRPYGSSGELAHSFSSLVAYYAGPAGDWEVQALLRMRPVGGSRALDNALLERAQAAYARFGDDPATRCARVFSSIQRMRALALTHRSRLGQGRDVKSGVGGLREIEFLVQGLQLVHLPRCAPTYRKIVDVLTARSFAVGCEVSGQLHRPSIGSGLSIRSKDVYNAPHWPPGGRDAPAHGTPTDGSPASRDYPELPCGVGQSSSRGKLKSPPAASLDSP